MDELIRIHNIILSTKVLGPGERAAIWFQGCRRRCPGCMAPETRPLNKGKTVSVKSMVDILRKLDGIEGITVSGGEPFLQKHSLYMFLKVIRETTKLGVIIYTGYTLEELKKMNDSDVNEILDGLCDLIIDGKYVDELNDGIALRGSSNQQLHFITERYKSYEFIYNEKRRNAEIYISNSDLFFIGIPSKETLKTWQTTTSEFDKRKE